MNIFINGQRQQFDNHKDVTLNYALALFFGPEQQQSSFAVALNGEFIANEAYTTTYIDNNDSIDVLFPIVGG